MMQDCEFWGQWSTFGPCSATCGDAFESRTRVCVNGEPGDNGCMGDSVETGVCMLPSCDYWGEWTQVGECS